MSDFDFKQNSGLTCFVLLARHYHIDMTPESLIHKYIITSHAMEPSLLIRMAKDSGFKANKINLNWNKLFHMLKVFPFIAQLKDDRYVIVSGIRGNPTGGQIAIVDPASGSSQFFFYEKEQWEELWDGKAILLKKIFKINDEKQPFSMRWFIQEMFRQKTLMKNIAIGTFTVNILSLAFAIYIQLVLDRVIGHKSYSTLNVLSVGIIGILVIDAILTYIKKYILLFMTNKIDLRLNLIIFAQLLRIPIDFYDNTQSGLIFKHVFHKEKIREFITGRLLTSVFDATILFILIPILFFYSVTLTVIVLAATFLVALIIGLSLRELRERLKLSYSTAAASNTHLVECVRGMHTVKALAIEPLQFKVWESLTAANVGAAFRVEKFSNAIYAISYFIQHLLPVAIVWVGATLVFDNTITLGALVAFQILSRRMIEPTMQIVTLLHEFQEIGLSVALLGEIMNRPPERSSSTRGLVSPITGSISVEGMSFRYDPGAPKALNDINLFIPAGSIIGIVGRSGSGKSTLTRLIQGLYSIQEGRITIDGIDIRDIDLAHLRRSMGVVLQENFLFQGTLRQNIVATRPTASFEEVIMACRLAGADEFIQRLPNGYDTPIREGGSNLSGGQKQRVAIARALIMKPSIIILDEATSALDAESEAIIQSNLAGIAQGRTLIIVSHRLSMLSICDSIIVLDKGNLIANAPHDVLLQTCPLYADLWYKQNKHVLVGQIPSHSHSTAEA